MHSYMIKTSLLNDFLKLRYIFSSKAFIFRKNLLEPLVRLTEGDVASIGPPITQFAIFLSIMYVH